MGLTRWSHLPERDQQVPQLRGNALRHQEPFLFILLANESSVFFKNTLDPGRKSGGHRLTEGTMNEREPLRTRTIHTHRISGELKLGEPVRPTQRPPMSPVPPSQARQTHRVKKRGLLKDKLAPSSLLTRYAMPHGSTESTADAAMILRPVFRHDG